MAFASKGGVDLGFENNLLQKHASVACYGDEGGDGDRVVSKKIPPTPEHPQDPAPSTSSSPTKDSPAGTPPSPIPDPGNQEIIEDSGEEGDSGQSSSSFPETGSYSSERQVGLEEISVTLLGSEKEDVNEEKDRVKVLSLGERSSLLSFKKDEAAGNSIQKEEDILPPETSGLMLHIKGLAKDPNPISRKIAAFLVSLVVGGLAAKAETGILFPEARPVIHADKWDNDVFYVVNYTLTVILGLSNAFEFYRKAALPFFRFVGDAFCRAKNNFSLTTPLRQPLLTGALFFLLEAGAVANSFIKTGMLWQLEINAYEGDPNDIPFQRRFTATAGGIALFAFLTFSVTKKVLSLAQTKAYEWLAPAEEQESQAWLKAFFRGQSEKVDTGDVSLFDLENIKQAFLKGKKDSLSINKPCLQSLLPEDKKIQAALKIMAPSEEELDDFKATDLTWKDRAFRVIGTILTGFAAWATWNLLRESFLKLLYVVDDVSPLYSPETSLEEVMRPIDPFAGVFTGLLFFVMKDRVAGFFQTAVQDFLGLGDHKKSTHVSLYPKGTRILFAASLLWGAFMSFSIWGFGQHMIHWNEEDWPWFKGDVKNFFVVSLVIATAEDAMRKSREFQGGMRAAFFHLFHNRLTRKIIGCFPQSWQKLVYGDLEDQERYKLEKLLRTMEKESKNWDLTTQQQLKEAIYGKKSFSVEDLELMDPGENRLYPSTAYKKLERPEDPENQAFSKKQDCRSQHPYLYYVTLIPRFLIALIVWILF